MVEERRCWICGRSSKEIKKLFPDVFGTQVIYKRKTVCCLEVDVCMVCSGVI